MIGKQFLPASLISIALSVVMASQSAVANATLSAPVISLTRQEQAQRVSALASQATGSRLFSTSVEMPALAPYFQRNYRPQWVSVSVSLNERIRLAERIGNQGVARFSAEQGYTKILGSQDRGIVQGPDRVVWDTRTGYVRVLEAKGGSSPLKKTYDTLQGTNRNAILSCETALKSNSTTPLEKEAAARVIKAAQANRLQTGVVRTSHVLGTPDAPGLEGKWDTVNVAEEARKIEQRNPAAASIFRKAGTAQYSDMWRYRAGQGLTVLGLAGSGLLGWDAYQQSRSASEMWHDPTLRGTPLPFLQTGFAVGRWAEAETLGLGPAATRGWLGTGGLSTFGRAAGKWFLPLAVGVEGLSAGIASYQYSTGRISQREFYRRSTGPAIFALFTTGGAIIGGFGGASAAGGGAVPGAIAGAKIGALAAVPAAVVADWSWNWYYSKFDESQRAAVDRAVERHYEVSSQ